MRVFVLLAFCACGFAQQSPNVDVAQILADRMAPPSDADRVIAVVDGNKITAAEVYRYYKTLSSGMQYNLAQDRNELLQRYVVSRNIVKEAEKDKLDQKEPYKTRLLESREQILTQARYDEVSDTKSLTDQEKQKFYNEHQDAYTFALARVIMVPTGSGDPKERAAEIVKRIRGGESFDAVARQVSADRQTADKGGLIGLVAKVGPFPEEVRKAVFALKPGETGDPVEYHGNLLIFAVDSIQIKPYDQVKQDVLDRMKQDLVDRHLEAVRSRLNVKIEDEGYFKKPDVPQSLTVGESTSPAPKQ